MSTLVRWHTIYWLQQLLHITMLFQGKQETQFKAVLTLQIAVTQEELDWNTTSIVDSIKEQVSDIGKTCIISSIPKK